ncbi:MULTISPECIES: hypothetical protein [unclassified Amycolatopsis]|uniref:hypothetical protein n=1 Tax=unclassified Amycolatopsis TaxID=2618356 RepID=UPI001FF233EB|nr:MULTISPECIES: hypothetical protein [unclassified Amycolatopsis]UOZ06121.1 hypothetical protein MUY22_46175 [Amycolatopsis sp. WQ 127309]WSJ81737.1 hypothetical protein OG439_22915 [Amycolatopsis sp. NBC_01307]WSK74890.1 hypothetical protein OG570_26160 [Amycolatopsis sp. NBC_01286]
MDGDGKPRTTVHPLVNHRMLAMLRAVGAGRGLVSCSSEPDLFIDGLSCGDQFAAHALAHLGLISATCTGRPGELVPAVLTPAGQAIVTGEQRPAA